MTPALADPVAAPPGAIDLLLIRLLPTTKAPPTPKTVRGYLDRCLPRPLTGDQWEALAAVARADGLVTPRGLRLTEVGRTRAQTALGIEELPPNCPWRTVEGRYLAPVAAGLKPPAAGGTSPSVDQLAARALIAKFELPLGHSATLVQVLNALVSRRLGFPTETDPRRLVRRVLSREIRSDELLSAGDLKKKFPRVELDLPAGSNGLRTKLVRDWLARRTERQPQQAAPEEFDLAAFAATVKAAARDCPTGRFGERSVFINHLWRYLQAEPGVPRLHLPAFKRRLVEANTARLIDLLPADLLQAADPADVAGSETVHLNATYHLVRAA
jgi:hypothetical protein